MLYNKPFFIAEISGNHCGKISLAKKLILCAKKNGASAVKIQSYSPETMTLNSKKKYFKINKGLWKNYTLWDLYNEAQTPFSWHKELFAYAKKIGITIFSTPFDETAVDLLEKLNCPIYKVSSFEMNDLLLIKKIASTKKPMIISTGMSSLKEIEITYQAAKKYGAKDVSLLYCVSNYPAKISDFSLNNIKIMKERFQCKVGLSDHSKDSKIAVAAVALGAVIIEKHIALEGQKKGLDIEFSLRGSEIKSFKSDINLAYQLISQENFVCDKKIKKNIFLRRSIFVTRDIKKNEKFTVKNIKRIRPGYGLEPKYYNMILGKKSPTFLKSEYPLKKNILKKYF